MRKIFNVQQMFFSLAIVTVILSSCGGAVSKPDDMINPEKMKATGEKFQKAIGADKQVRQILINAQDHLTNQLGNISADVVTADKQITQNFIDDKLSVYSEKTIENAASIPTIAVKDFDFSKVVPHYQEAIKLIPAQYENFMLRLYRVEPDAAKAIQTYFVIEGTKKGEKKEQSGRMITTNYYEFKFDVDAAGKMTMKD